MSDEDKQQQDTFDWKDMFKFLQTEAGREAVHKLLDHLDLRKGRSTEVQRHEIWHKTIIGCIAVGGAIVLSYNGEMDPSTGVIIGSVVGYVLGNKNS